MDDLVLARRDDAILTLTLNRPERRNPLSLEMIGALTDRLEDAGGAAVVILAASGPAFCAGHDLREMVERDERFYRTLFDRCTALMQLIHELPVPVIAQVQGIATAAGCQLVAACDLAVASTDARFATPGVKIGLFCSTPMVEVSRAIGPKRAMEMLLTGDPISAQTASDWGLVNRVVAPDELASSTADLARRISAASPFVVGLGKRVFYETIARSREDAYALATQVMCANALDADAQEGFAAFLAKRAPSWNDR